MADLNLLIQRWQVGDERAAEAIYNQFRGLTFGLALALLGNAADAEEVTQDSLTYALTHINRYDGQRAKFSTWLHRIVVNTSLSYRRKFKRIWQQTTELNDSIEYEEQHCSSAHTPEESMLSAIQFRDRR